MRLDELQRLAAFSQSVRQATILKFRSVPNGKEAFRLDPNGPCFIEFIKYLLACDQCLFDTVKARMIVPYPALGRAAEDPTLKNRQEFEKMIESLEESQKKRWRLIKDFPLELTSEMPEDPTSDKLTTWWSVLRGNLDNEIQTRDRIVPVLRKALVG